LKGITLQIDDTGELNIKISELGLFEALLYLSFAMKNIEMKAQSQSNLVVDQNTLSNLKGVLK
jgi:hypothetical protein